MLQRRCSFLASPLLCALALTSAAYGQTSSSDVKLPVSAALVLTPEFCSTNVAKTSFKTGKRTFEVGQAVCASIEQSLNGVFSSLTRVPAESASGNAQAVLLPRIVNVDATTPMSGLSDTKLVVSLEWTVKDKSGKTVWIATVQGAGKHKIKGVNPQGDLRLLMDDSAKDVSEQSARKMSSAPELRKLN